MRSAASALDCIIIMGARLPRKVSHRGKLVVQQLFTPGGFFFTHDLFSIRNHPLAILATFKKKEWSGNSILLFSLKHYIEVQIRITNCIVCRLWYGLHRYCHGNNSVTFGSVIPH